MKILALALCLLLSGCAPRLTPGQQLLIGWEVINRADNEHE